MAKMVRAFFFLLRVNGSICLFGLTLRTGVGKGDLVVSGDGVLLSQFEQFHVLHAFADFLLDFVAEFRIVLQEQAGVLATLADTFVVVAEPGATLLDDVQFAGEVQDGGFAGDAATVKDVEFALGEGGGHLVLDHLDAGAVTDDFFAVLDGGDTADIDTLGGVELKGVATGGGFGVAEHDANLHAELVDEQHAGVGLGKNAGELAEGLAHEAGLQTHVVVAHFTVDFGLGHEGSYRVDDDDVDGTGTYEGFGDVQGLLTGVGLRDEERLDIDAQLAGVHGIKGVFGVDEGGYTAKLLGFGNGVEGEGSLTGGFGSVNLDDTAAGETAYAEGHVQLDTARRDDGDFFDGLATESHDRTFPVVLLDLGDGRLDGFSLFAGKVAGGCCRFFSHD